MPTGYTEAVGSGKITTLKQFALQCARGMGACITMRDEPWDATIPERFEPHTSHYDGQLAAARALLVELDGLSPEECAARAASDYQERLKSYEEYKRKRNEENGRYERMLAEVRGWQTEAEGIRDFMIDQLQISIVPMSSLPPHEMPADEWLRDARLAAMRNITYHEKAIADEVHRTAGRNIWLAALRRSLDDAPAASGGEQ